MRDLPGFTITEPGEPVPRARLPPRATCRRTASAGARRRDVGAAWTRRRGGRASSRQARGGRAPKRGAVVGRGQRRRRGARPRRSGADATAGERWSRRRGGLPDASRSRRRSARSSTRARRSSSRSRRSRSARRARAHEPRLAARPLRRVPADGRSRRHLEAHRLRQGARAPARGDRGDEAAAAAASSCARVAEGLTKKQLKQDVGYLVRLWGEIAKKRESARGARRALRASSTSCSRPRATSSPTTSRRSSSTTASSTSA